MVNIQNFSSFYALQAKSVAFSATRHHSDGTRPKKAAALQDQINRTQTGQPNNAAEVIGRQNKANIKRKVTRHFEDDTQELCRQVYHDAISKFWLKREDQKINPRGVDILRALDYAQNKVAPPNVEDRGFGLTGREFITLLCGDGKQQVKKAESDRLKLALREFERLGLIEVEIVPKAIDICTDSNFYAFRERHNKFIEENPGTSHEKTGINEVIKLTELGQKAFDVYSNLVKLNC